MGTSVLETKAIRCILRRTYFTTQLFHICVCGHRVVPGDVLSIAILKTEKKTNKPHCRPSAGTRLRPAWGMGREDWARPSPAWGTGREDSARQGTRLLPQTALDGESDRMHPFMLSWKLKK